MRVLITGGQGDLGQAMAKELQRQQAEVFAPGRVELDVRNEAQIQAYFAAQPGWDVLIANAGIARDKSMVALPAPDFAEVLDVGLRGAFLCTREAVKSMIKQKQGHILLIGSRAAKYGTHGQSAYAAAKAGLVALAQSVAKEYGGRNIRCNVVLPGFMETKFTAHLSPERKVYIQEEHALRRFNTPENAARFIAFLAQIDHVSGQVFTLDSRIDAWT